MTDTISPLAKTGSPLTEAGSPSPVTASPGSSPGQRDTAAVGSGFSSTHGISAGKQGVYPGTHGAFPSKDGTTYFALWAPDADWVAVKLGDGTTHEMKPAQGGWFNVTLECTAGTQYLYVINSELEIPDPASRAQVGDVHGPSYVVDHAYPWKSVTWHGKPWNETVIYELHVGLFGGFAKVEEFLPELVKLGVTAIELMPINEFPGERNWGYDGVLLFAPSASYGTPDELKSLIDTAHSLDLMVFVDVVYNHFGPDGNYINQYAKCFFRDDIKTLWGSAIDFRQREVRDFFCENALMWVQDYHVDGLRLDAVHAISETDFLVELASRVRGATLPGHHVHLMLENENNNASLLLQGFDAQWNDDGHNVLHHLLTGESEGYYANFASSPTSKLARSLSDEFIYPGAQKTSSTDAGTSTGSLANSPDIQLPPTAFVLFLQNHDQVGNRAFGERLTQLADHNQLKAATVLLLLSPMIPLLFMGEEWGSKQPFLYFTDHHDELAKAVCEGRRNEFAAFSKFSDESIRDQIPDPNAPGSFVNSRLDFDAHTSEHQEWWDFYNHLLALRRTEIIPRLSGAYSEGASILGDGAVCAAWRLGDKSLLRIYLNLSPVAVDATPAWGEARLIFDHQVQRQDYLQNVLPAYSAFVTVEGDPDRAALEAAI